ncbi:MAG: hypothetical protein CM15mP74_22160 [Halieaceae bacterium]|nr:MAG: hypothetical protein CM15mP74_22160 [Halieaceae bacterium]
MFNERTCLASRHADGCIAVDCLAQGRIAVVNLEQAILQTDVAQQRLQEFESNEDFASDKSQFDALREELDQLVKDFQRDQAAMSEEDQVAARQKMAASSLTWSMLPRSFRRFRPECTARDAGAGASGTGGAAGDYRD